MTSSLAESLGKGHTAAGWARDFLRAIGAPATPANVAFVVKWEKMESGGGGGKFNPLNSVLGAPGATSVNSVGVKNYTSYQQGIQASASTFLGSQWAGVVNALKRNDQQGAQAAINAEYATWGGGPINILGGDAGNVVGSAGGTATLTSADTTTTDASDDDCLWKLPELKVGPVHAGGNCLFKRSNGRALLGAAALVSGTVLLLAGVGIVAIGSKPGREITSAAVLGATAGAASG